MPHRHCLSLSVCASSISGFGCQRMASNLHTIISNSSVRWWQTEHGSFVSAMSPVAKWALKETTGLQESWHHRRPLGSKVSYRPPCDRRRLLVPECQQHRSSVCEFVVIWLFMLFIINSSCVTNAWNIRIQNLPKNCWYVSNLLWINV